MYPITNTYGRMILDNRILDYNVIYEKSKIFKKSDELDIDI